MFSNAFIKVSALLVGMSLLPSGARAAATIVIQNGDPAGLGFNDPNTVAPVGGNSGTTLGQQRLIAFQAAANKWGATITSATAITVLATWEALPCTATAATLGSAGALTVWRDFIGAQRANTWYSEALANSLYFGNLDPATPEIRARFNVNLGKAGCLEGAPFYLGLDNNHGTQVDLVTVLTHELAHGLGFQTFTNGSTGAYLAGFPSVWDHFLFDNNLNRPWTQMSASERAASSISVNRLVWNGPQVTNDVPNVLQRGVPQVAVSSPASAAGNYPVGTASFGAPLTAAGVTGEVARVIDTAPSLGLACDPLSSVNAAAVAGKIALVDRGNCSFSVKAKNVQDAGAIAVLIVNNAPGAAPGLGGTDPSVYIPAAGLSQADGTRLKAAVSTGSRRKTGVQASLGINETVFAGADGAGRALMYTPNPFIAGSSVSHWDTTATPNQLMEPNISADLTHEVIVPFDLTYSLLRDIGWQ